MPGLRVGVQLTGLKLPFKQALHAASRMGAEAVEIDARFDIKASELVGTALRQVRKLLEDLNLRVASIRYPTRRGYECEEELERRIEGTKQAMKLAYDLGASVVVNHVGEIPESEDSPKLQVLRTVLSDLGTYSHRIGAFLACETGAEPLSRLGSPDLSRPAAPDRCGQGEPHAQSRRRLGEPPSMAIQFSTLVAGGLPPPLRGEGNRIWRWPVRYQACRLKKSAKNHLPL